MAWSLLSVVLILSISKYFGNVKHKFWLPGLLVCCNYACIMYAFGSVFRVHYEIHGGPVTSTCVSHCQSLVGIKSKFITSSACKFINIIKLWHTFLNLNFFLFRGIILLSTFARVHLLVPYILAKICRFSSIHYSVS